jgi:DNA-binding NarL/FixJ family response regulator
MRTLGNLTVDETTPRGNDSDSDAGSDRQERALTVLRQTGVSANALAQCGRIDEALTMIADAERTFGGDAPLHPFAAVKGYIAIQGSGDVDSAYREQLLALGEEGVFADLRTFNEILGTMIMCAHVRGNSEWWGVASAIGVQNRGRLDPVNAFTLDSFKEFARSKWDGDTECWREVEASAVAGPAWKSTTLRVAVSNLNWRVHETKFIDHLLGQLNADQHGLAAATVQISLTRRNAGLWRERGDQARMVLRAISDRGLYYLEARLQGILAVTDAYLGNVAQATEHAVIGAAWAGPRGFQLVLEDTRHARTVIALAKSDFESAYAILIEFPIEAHRWEISGHGAAELLNLAEACDGVGRPQDALPAVSAAILHGVDSQTVRQAMALHAAQAILEPDEETAGRLFESALAMEDAADSSFDSARVRLAYSHFLLRRRRDSSRAQVQLDQAISDFDALGASEWAARATRELATSRRSTPSAATSVAGLSPQEQLVASYAAQGLTNKEIAKRLFISARTVSYHLYNVFPKLGVTSRAALRDALTSLVADDAESA